MHEKQTNTSFHSRAHFVGEMLARSPSCPCQPCQIHQEPAAMMKIFELICHLEAFEARGLTHFVEQQSSSWNQVTAVHVIFALGWLWDWLDVIDNLIGHIRFLCALWWEQPLSNQAHGYILHYANPIPLDDIVFEQLLGKFTRIWVHVKLPFCVQLVNGLAAKPGQQLILDIFGCEPTMVGSFQDCYQRLAFQHRRPQLLQTTHTQTHSRTHTHVFKSGAAVNQMTLGIRTSRMQFLD
mmetsp:Transcript_5433/g.14325  ORF Transcript_5433/g.14325 Transcript_5433/m.14325 type:complete len:238 (+) Transcript_5433:447-1160(+)